MPLEVYSATRPAARWRGVLAAGGLLVAASGLALVVVSKRAAQPLVARILPSGWAISFEPPSGFAQGDQVVTALGNAVPFRRELPTGQTVECTVWRVPADLGDDVSAVAALIIGQYQDGWLLRLLSPGGVGRTSSLGPLAAIELGQPARAPQILVRAALGPDGRSVYAVSLAVNGGVIDAELHTVLENVAASVRVHQ